MLTWISRPVVEDTPVTVNGTETPSSSLSGIARLGITSKTFAIGGASIGGASAGGASTSGSIGWLLWLSPKPQATSPPTMNERETRDKNEEL